MMNKKNVILRNTKFVHRFHCVHYAFEVHIKYLKTEKSERKKKLEDFYKINL